MGCSTSLMKYILAAFNLVFFLLGAGALGIGIWTLTGENKMLTLASVGADQTDFNVVGLLENSAFTIIAGGSFVMVLGFLGCWGALKENKIMLCTYGIITFLILAIQFASIGLAVQYKDVAETKLKWYIKTAINTTYDGQISSTSRFSLAFDFAQIFFECCGVDSPSDFEGSVKWNRTSDVGTFTIPVTCCVLTNKDSYLTGQASGLELENRNCPVTKADSYADTPCWNAIHDWLLARLEPVMGVAAGIALTEITCIVLACCIIRTIRNEK